MCEFIKYGFKRCKGIPKDCRCFYLCVARGKKMIFVSPEVYMIIDWDDTDTRIHERPNCRYRDRRDAMDITYQLIKADLLTMAL